MKILKKLVVFFLFVPFVYAKDANSISNIVSESDVLFYIAKVGIEDEDSIRFFVKNGAGINRQDKYGRTPLHYASKNGHKNVYKIFVNLGADASIADKFGKKPDDLTKH